MPRFSTVTPDNIVAFIGDVLERRGADSYLGEAVTMREHMLQSAQQAEAAGAGDELIAAALLHDIGHYTGEFPEDALEKGVDNHHETAGAAVIAPFFPERVTACVRWHVAAKRLLCATDPAYFDRLSAASVHTLRLQGGPMGDVEVAAFRQHPHLKAIVQVRLWDDSAKVPGRATPPFAHYAPVLRRVVNSHANQRRRDR